MSKIKLTHLRSATIMVSQTRMAQERGTSVISTLAEAMIRIDELERENKELKAEIEHLKMRNLGGRKKHNESWKASYQEFAIKYEAGMTIMKIVEEGKISRRTAYRYKTYFDEMINKAHESDMSDKRRTYD